MGKKEKEKEKGQILGVPRKRFWMISGTVVLVFLAVVGIIWFSGGYYRLDKSIQNERVESVGQIGQIILEKIELMSTSYGSELEQAANILMSVPVETRAEALALLGSPDDLCFLCENGNVWDTQGNPVYFNDVQSIFENLSGDEATSQFGSIQTKGDYWIFSTALDGVVLDGVNTVGLLKLVDAETYSNVTTNAIFGNQGASYVVNSDGVVLLRPDNPEVNSYFSSYNILSDMRAEGVDEESIATLSDALSQNKPAQIVADMGDTTWLIQSMPDTGGRNIVLTVPISITAKDTFTNMRATILGIVLLMFSVALIFIIWIFYFIGRDGQTKLEQAKAHSKSDFMNKVSHDIRTPLNAIVGMIEIAQRSVDDEEAVNKCLDSAKKSSEYLVSIINDVLDMSRIESNKMSIDHEPFDLKDMLDSIMTIEESPAKVKGLNFILDDKTEEGFSHVGDCVRIKQCLINLISNSVKFTPPGGTILLRCDEEKSGDEALLRFRVEDTGIGMSQEFMDHMFDPFEQERSSGTAAEATGSGLGLSIVYSLINLMGGEIQVTSEENKGTRFRITIPVGVVPKEISAEEEASIISRQHLRGKRVLVTEDNAVNRSIAVFVLEELGIVVEEAENGKVALDKFTESDPGYYDLILMDIQMPVMDGLTAARAIRSSDHPEAETIPIVALSANAFHEDAAKSLEAGIQAHLPKPIDTAQLEATLSKYIK